VQRVRVDEEGGRCRDVGGTRDGTAAFLYVQPCAASASVGVGLDTTTLPNGAHHVVVSVLDAAGNSATVIDRTVTVANATPCASGGASGSAGGAVLSARWRGTNRDAIVSGFAIGHAIDGTLTSASGTPIADAPVEVSTAPISGSAAARAGVVAHTRADGHFSVTVPAGGPSRAVCVAFRNGAAVATRMLTLSVRAAVALRVSPRTAHMGKTIRFRGRLRGGGVPAGGKPVILEARSPGGRWLQFRVVRSDARGRFRASYRFRFAGPATYEFRVLCEPESDYPFARGHSKVVRVRER
jgi:hypothetical protein